MHFNRNTCRACNEWQKITICKRRTRHVHSIAFDYAVFTVNQCHKIPSKIRTIAFRRRSNGMVVNFALAVVSGRSLLIQFEKCNIWCENGRHLIWAFANTWTHPLESRRETVNKYINSQKAVGELDFIYARNSVRQVGRRASHLCCIFCHERNFGEQSIYTECLPNIMKYH